MARANGCQVPRRNALRVALGGKGRLKGSLSLNLPSLSQVKFIRRKYLSGLVDGSLRYFASLDSKIKKALLAIKFKKLALSEIARIDFRMEINRTVSQSQNRKAFRVYKRMFIAIDISP